MLGWNFYIATRYFTLYQDSLSVYIKLNRVRVLAVVNLMPLSIIFQLYLGDQNYLWRKLETTDKLDQIILYWVHLIIMVILIMCQSGVTCNTHRQLFQWANTIKIKVISMLVLYKVISMLVLYKVISMLVLYKVNINHLIKM